MYKISLIIRNLRTSLINNSRVVRIKNAKFAGYCEHKYVGKFSDLHFQTLKLSVYQVKLFNRIRNFYYK